MLTNNYNYSVLLTWNPRTQNSLLTAYTNTTGADITLPIGLVLGRIDATKKLWPMRSAATDGSQKPIGVLANTVIVPNGATIQLTMVIAGDVVAPALVFDNGTDTLATNVAYNTSGDIIGTIGDILNGRGILCVPSTDGTFYDNN